MFSSSNMAFSAHLGTHAEAIGKGPALGFGEFHFRNPGPGILGIQLAGQGEGRERAIVLALLPVDVPLSYQIIEIVVALWIIVQAGQLQLRAPRVTQRQRYIRHPHRYRGLVRAQCLGSSVHALGERVFVDPHQYLSRIQIVVGGCHIGGRDSRLGKTEGHLLLCVRLFTLLRQIIDPEPAGPRDGSHQNFPAPGRTWSWPGRDGRAYVGRPHSPEGFCNLLPQPVRGIDCLQRFRRPAEAA